MNMIPLFEHLPSVLECAVIAHGEFPKQKLVLDRLMNARKVICCDGAAEDLLAHGRMPDAVVGDCDSLSHELRDQLGSRVIHVREQETNDLCKCMRYLKAEKIEHVVIFGATGKREDHTLGNLSLLPRFRQQFASIMAVSDYGCFTPILETTTFESWPGQQVSIFAFSPVPRITLHGLKYPLNATRPEGLWTATLNQAEQGSFMIELLENGPVVIDRVFSEL